MYKLIHYSLKKQKIIENVLGIICGFQGWPDLNQAI